MAASTDEFKEMGSFRPASNSFTCKCKTSHLSVVITWKGLDGSAVWLGLDLITGAVECTALWSHPTITIIIFRFSPSFFGLLLHSWHCSWPSPSSADCLWSEKWHKLATVAIATSSTVVRTTAETPARIIIIIIIFITAGVTITTIVADGDRMGLTPAKRIKNPTPWLWHGLRRW